MPPIEHPLGRRTTFTLRIAFEISKLSLHLKTVAHSCILMENAIDLASLTLYLTSPGDTKHLGTHPVL